jgi:two-component system sensor histidine kinase BaeS
LSLSLSALPRALSARRPRPVGPTLPEEPELVERRWLDLRASLEEISRSCGAMLRAAGIELEHRLPDVALGVWADPGELRQAFAHIVRLGCDAMPRGGVLKTLARRENGQAVVSFMDSSLASGHQPCLAARFDRLFDARQAHAAQEGELRAGALLSRRIVDRLGGRLYAAPSALGGMGITLRMPLAPARDVHEAATAGVTLGSAS